MLEDNKTEILFYPFTPIKKKKIVIAFKWFLMCIGNHENQISHVNVESTVPFQYYTVQPSDHIPTFINNFGGKNLK